MSYKHTTYALEAAETLELSARAAHVLLVIAAHAGPDGVAWPSVARLADLVRRHRARTLDALAELEAAGALAVERTPGKANRYRLPVMDAISTTSRASATSSASATSRASATHPSRQRDHTSRASATRTDKEQFKNNAREAHPALARCPQRTGRRFCDESCETCGGSGHVAIAATGTARAVGEHPPPKWTPGAPRWTGGRR